MSSQNTDLDPLNILVLGPTGVGKSTIINHLTSQQLPVAHSLRSCTQEVQVASIEHRGRQINYFDTPGFGDSILTSAEQLARITALSSALYDAAKQAPNIHGILYVHRITDNKMSRPAVRNLRTFEKLLGSEAAKNTVFVTNMWGGEPDPELVVFEQELTTDREYFARAIENGARAGEKYRIYKDANESQVRDTLMDLFLDYTPVTLQIQRDMAAEKRALRDTEAGQIIGKEVKEFIEETKEHLREVETELKKRHSAGGEEGLIREQKDVEQQYEQAQEQEGILDLVLEMIRKHPRWSAFVVLAVVGATAAGVIMLGPGNAVVVAKFAGEAKLVASGTSTAAATTASPMAGVCTAAAAATGAISVSVDKSVGLVVLAAAALVGLVKGSKQNKERTAPN
ncbi:50S ribosome-binding GTPase [Rhizoctonia solani 123E]|uniref:50S ribosome-binding GTPase n=1 Tax=Rhizoctonia solani 123E TaxID=1423351 RepID=A0A074SK07_9AGAM|nr:50S ribosome-binding GTPase [Rhizoctonia solani 123E]